MLGKRQIEILKKLGYVESNEEGAVLDFLGANHILFHIWKDANFDFVLRSHNDNVRAAERSRILGIIRRNEETER